MQCADIRREFVVNVYLYSQLTADFVFLQGGPMMIRMRYSQFDELRELLVQAFPHAKHALPPLPPKSALFKFRPKFLETRRIGLQYFLNCVLLNPEFSGSPVLKDFLFSHIN